MQELVEYIVKGIVDLPDEVSVSANETGQMVVYEVSVAQSDLGKVIGRGGRIAEAIRQIVRAAHGPDGLRATVDIVSLGGQVTRPVRAAA